MFIVPQDDEDEVGFLGRIKEVMGMRGGKSLEDIAPQRKKISADKPKTEEEKKGDDANS